MIPLCSAARSPLMAKPLNCEPQIRRDLLLEPKKAAFPQECQSDYRGHQLQLPQFTVTPLTCWQDIGDSDHRVATVVGCSLAGRRELPYLGQTRNETRSFYSQLSGDAEQMMYFRWLVGVWCPFPHCFAAHCGQAELAYSASLVAEGEAFGTVSPS